jgi:hypothetical protein
MNHTAIAGAYQGLSYVKVNLSKNQPIASSPKKFALKIFIWNNFSPLATLDEILAKLLIAMQCVIYPLVPFSQAELIADGVSGIAWYPVKQVPELAFDHNRILEYGHRRLRNKLEYSPVAFDVLPEAFTLSDLYQLYTTVLGENFSDYSNFRTRLLKLGFLSDTGIKTSRGAGRPASLYRFDAEAFAPFKNKPMVFI